MPSVPDVRDELVTTPTPPPPAPEPPPRRVPQTVGGTVFVVIVGIVLVGLALVVWGAWRTGIVWMGVAMLVGALTRAVLSERAAGMLRVRRRWSDVVLLTVSGLGLITLAVIVPSQPL
jgi:hypothetical protein